MSPSRIGESLQEHLQRIPVGVGPIIDEVIEGISKTGLSEHFKRGATIPAVHVNHVGRTVLRESIPDSGFELQTSSGSGTLFTRISDTVSVYLVSDTVEYMGHVADMSN